MSCDTCKQDLGTAHFIEGAVPDHVTVEHWTLTKTHSTAKELIRLAGDLVGDVAVLQALANMRRAEDVEKQFIDKLKRLAQ